MADLGEDLGKILGDYRSDVIQAMDTAADKCIEQVTEEIKSHVTFNGKKYIRAFAVAKDTSHLKNNRTWYVKAPYYRLTHLLENGHATRNGGRTKAFPHIKYGEEFARDNYDRIVAEEVEKIVK